MDSHINEGGEQSKPGWCMPFRVAARNIRLEVAGVEYEWGGGFGEILTSRERGVKEGDVRMIGNVTFHAYIVRLCSHRWVKPEVCWTIPYPHCTAEWIREFKASLFA